MKKNPSKEAPVESRCHIRTHAQPSLTLSQTPFAHWLLPPLILIGLTFTNTILIMTQQNASGAGHVVTGCLEVY